MRKAREVYQRSLALLGQEEGKNTEAFEARAVSLINVLLADAEETDRVLKGMDSARSASILQIRDLEDSVGVEDALALSLFPLGLAAFLIQEEEPERASFFLQLYQSRREALLRRGRFGRRHKIKRSF